MEESLPLLRHAARGCLNSIRLCVSALELDCTFEERVEFIQDIIASADKLDDLVQKVDNLFETGAAAPSGQKA
jgi:hypothetical protein